MLLAQSGDPRRAWEAYAGFVARLIGENVLSCDDFGSQCTGFFRSDRDQATLKNFAAFLTKFVGLYKTNEGDDRKFAFLLDFLSDFCSDL
ncbi:hypothetical protein NQ318_015049 [Aromia moschata]|uniref:Uncharacterized protein n=1 Tax=Aromia moschata TaxID=1265417 RepID=A0AAV8YYN9_9CUCU|nr:hypothetical protein NQ318_015049 [Aromia moschata]